MALRRLATKLADSTRKLARGKTLMKSAPKNAPRNGRRRGELVVITGMSGSGKASVLKAFEDLGYYCVDNLPVDLMPRFSELIKQSPEITRAALVVDVREGQKLERLPKQLQQLKETVKTTIIFLEASDDVLLRRFSETRRPHPLSRRSDPVKVALGAERKRLGKLRDVADIVIDTSKFNVHELRAYVTERFQREHSDKNILVSCVSFGYKHGVPQD